MQILVDISLNTECLFTAEIVILLLCFHCYFYCYCLRKKGKNKLSSEIKCRSNLETIKQRRIFFYFCHGTYTISIYLNVDLFSQKRFKNRVIPNDTRNRSIALFRITVRSINIHHIIFVSRN